MSHITLSGVRAVLQAKLPSSKHQGLRTNTAESSKGKPAHRRAQALCIWKTLPVISTGIAKNGFRSAFSVLSLRQDIQQVVLVSKCAFSTQYGQAVSLFKSHLMSDASQLSSWPLSSPGFTFYLDDP